MLGRSLSRALPLGGLLLGGVLALMCSRPPPTPLLDELASQAVGEARPQWPPPPAEPRIRYLGAIDGEQHFEPRRSVWKRLSTLLFPDPGLHFVRPAGACVWGQRLAVADPGAGLVHVLDLYERRWEALARTSEGVLRSPVDVACLPDGRLVVSDSALETLWLYDAAGQALGRFTDARLARPTGIVFDGVRSRLWVVETLGHRVRAFDLAGRELLRVGERGLARGRFNYPTMLATTPEGGVWLTDALNFRLHYIDDAGRPGHHFGVAGDRAGAFARPRGLAVDAEGRIFAVDALFEAVQIFDPEGHLLLVFGERGSEPGQFWLPADVALDGQGHVYVIDSYNRRVQIFAYRPPAAS